MSDHYHTLTVVLEHDIKDEDAEPLIEAIGMLRGVLSVRPHVAEFVTHMAEERARRELGSKLLDILYPQRKESP